MARAFILAMGLMMAVAGGASAQTPAPANPGWTPDPRVDAAFQDAIAVVPLNLRLVERRDAYLSGRESDGEPMTHDDDDRLLAELRGLKIESERMVDVRVSPDDLMGACVDVRLQGCSPLMGGFINLGREDDALPRRLFWQIQDGFTYEDGVQGGWVVLEAEGARLNPLLWDFGGHGYGAPIPMGRDASGYDLIALSGRYGGTGSYNADVVIRWIPTETGSRYAQIDTWSWRGDLDARLPEGLEVWKGVAFDWPNQMASTQLWRSSDGNCCPTGGSALLSFSIADDRLILDEVRVVPAD